MTRMELLTNKTLSVLLDEKSFSALVTENDCLIYRFISVIFTIISILSFAFNLRFIILDRNRINSLSCSLIISSLLLIFFSLPYVIYQSIKCYPVHSFLMCSFQGFLCFTCGICVMYTMSLLALTQYIRLFYNTSILYRILEDRRSYLLPIFCWSVSFAWSLPAIFDDQPGFMREGQGFDCGLNWKRKTTNSYSYLILAFIFIYFTPLVCILYTNIRILITIRQLIRQRSPIVSNSDSIGMRHRLIDMFTVSESTRLKRLRIDRRFAQATLISVLHYLLIWTPYAACGIIQMILATKTIDYKLPGMLLSAAALTAKMGVIGQSTVYFYTVRPLNRRFSLTSTTVK